MVPTRRIVQFTLDPGESTELGTYKDDGGRTVTLSAAVDPCGGEGSTRTARVEKDGTTWNVRLSPDATLRLDGLLDDKDTKLSITVVAHGCPGTGGTADDDEPGGEPFPENVVDVVAEIDDPDVSAPL